MTDEIRADCLEAGHTYEDGIGSDPVTIAEVHMHGDTVVVTGTGGEEMALDRDEVVFLVQPAPTEPVEPTEKIAEVTITATEAWETWKVRVPIGADEDWVRENFHDLEDKWLDESGLEGSQSITTIEFEPDADSVALTNRPPF